MHGNKKRFRKTLLLLPILLPTVLHAGPKPAYVWTQLKSGLEYAKIEISQQNQPKAVHAFRIDPKKFRLQIVRTKQLKLQNTTAKELTNKSGALLVINGSFFNPEGKELGLIVDHGKIVNPLHPTSWWSVFYTTKKRVAIVSPQQFKLTPDIEMAIQVGPRLVINGQIPNLKNGLARRSAIGMTETGKIIIVATEALLTPKEMAEIMQKSRWQGGLECPNAMGLDGGSSTQLYATIGKFSLDIPGISLVPNGIGVFPHY